MEECSYGIRRGGEFALQSDTFSERSRKMDKKLMAMGTSMLLLKLLEGKEMYGYQMIKELEERSENVFAIKEGTLYPILHNLEKEGAVESFEKTADTGRVRKYYRLTKKGSGVLAQKESEWQVFQEAVEKVMKNPAYADLRVMEGLG